MFLHLSLQPDHKIFAILKTSLVYTVKSVRNLQNSVPNTETLNNTNRCEMVIHFIPEGEKTRKYRGPEKRMAC